MAKPSTSLLPGRITEARPSRSARSSNKSTIRSGGPTRANGHWPRGTGSSPYCSHSRRSFSSISPAAAADHVGQHHADGRGRPSGLRGCCRQDADALLQAGHRASETLAIVLNDGHGTADGGTHLPGLGRRVEVDVVGVTAGHLQRPGTATTEHQPGRHPGIR